MTLSLSPHDEFTILYVVIIFHRASHQSTVSIAMKDCVADYLAEAFEGLGLGTRLAFLQLPAKWDWVPATAALIYSVMTPLGMAIGLGAQGGLVGLHSSAFGV